MNESLEPRCLLAADPIISEIVADNQDSLLDGDGVASDWIEIYNAGDEPIDLAGWSLTDDPEELDQWQFPSVTLDDGGFLVVFASGQPTEDYVDAGGFLHTNFRLAAEGEFLALVRPDGTPAWQTNFPALEEDMSFGVPMQTSTQSLVGDGMAGEVAVRTLVPNESTPTDWIGNQEPFDDQAWLQHQGARGVGYAIEPDVAPGLVAEWTFETSNGVSTTGGQIAIGQIDETGQHATGPFHGTASGEGEQQAGGLTYIADVPSGIESNYSLMFPAPEDADNYVGISLEDSPLADLTIGDFRVEAWFKTTDTGRNVLIGSYVGPPSALNLELHTQNRGRLYLQGPGVGNTTDLNVTLPTDSRDGNWHQLVGLRRGETVELLYDGQLVGTTTDSVGDFSITQSTLYLGRDDRRTSVIFNGSLDQIRFFNSADESDLIAEYDFETVEGVPVTDGQTGRGQVDDSASALDVPAHGLGSSIGGGEPAGINYSSEVPETLVGSSTSLSIDESNRNTESFLVEMVPAIADLTQGDFTLQTWFRTTDTGRSILMGAYTGSHSALNFELHTDNRLRVYIENQSGSITDLNASLNLVGNSRDGQWHFATAVRRGNSVELYFDGQLVGQTTDVAGSFSQNAPAYYFGRDSRSGDTRFDGHLDDIRMWDAALSPESIAAMAEGMSPTQAISGNVDSLIGRDLEADMRGTQSSAYVRIPFQVEAPELLDQLVLNLQYDDGFVAWINGHEVARRHAPDTVGWNSMATEARTLQEAVTTEQVFVGSPRELLQAGENILAIQGLTTNVDAEQFLIVPELMASATEVTSETFSYFEQPTPRLPNRLGVQGFVDQPSFSVSRGFYEASDLEPGGTLSSGITLATETSDATIRYTIDGSWPTEAHGTVYAEPIQISTTTTLRAAAFRPGWSPSPIETQTYLFLEDVIRQPANPGANEPGDPTYPLPFPTTHQPGVRADYEMDPRVVNDPLYADSIIDDLKSIPTMSIVMDMDDIFNQPRGIWANSQASGREWERLTSVEYFDSQDADREFHVNSAIRIQGRASRVPSSSIKHAFRLIFKDAYGPEGEELPTGGPTKLEFPLFENSDVDRFDTLILRGGYNYSYLHGANDQNIRAQYIRERFMRESQLAMGQLSAHGSYVHLYVNGLYFGLYAPQERPDASFMAEHLGGDKDDYDVISAGEVRSGSDDAWKELLLRAREDLSERENYDAVLELLDVESLIDYMIVHIWGGTTDWPAPGGSLRNWVVGRNRETDDGFKFFVWDAEYSIQQVNDNRSNVQDANTPAFLYARLRRNEDFQVLFADRLQEHFFDDGALTPEKNLERYQALADEIEGAIVGESARWGDTRGDACNPCLRDPLWYDELDWVRNAYIPQRTDIVLDQFIRVDLYPEVNAPRLTTDAGQVPAGATVEMTARDIDTFLETELIGEPQPAMLHFPLDGQLERRWTNPDFVTGDDWTEGTTAIGFDSADSYIPWIVTDVGEAMRDVTSSVYVRTTFEHDAASDFDELQLRVLYDDAFVAYINGVEVARSSTMTSDELPFRTPPGSREARESETFVIDLSKLPADLLQAGDNVLAIHAANRTASNTDFLMRPELYGMTRQSAQGPRPLWYTIDGSDPRLPGGAINPAAMQYSGPLTIDSNVEIRARLFLDEQWSAIAQAEYIVEPVRLAVTELYYHPSSVTTEERQTLPGVEDDDFEFLEVHNPSRSYSVSLGDYALAGGVSFDFPDIELAPGQTVVIVENERAFRVRFGAEPQVLGEWSGKLSNGGELIELRIGSDVVNSIDYEDASPWPAQADGGGSSLTLSNLASPSLADSWQATPPTPGRFGSDNQPLEGDFDGNRIVDAVDLDLLALQMLALEPDLRFDLTQDGKVDRLDREHLVTQTLGTIYGDFNLDGRFDSRDLVQIFVAGEFEDQVEQNSTWAEGDADGDLEFSTRDLVLMFQAGGYDRS